jgi:DNA-binding XRE family transcriptional regulator
MERCEPVKITKQVPIPNPDGTGGDYMVPVEVEALRDPRDGEIYLTDAAWEKMDRTRARLMGILLPSQLKELRDRLGLTQKAMCDLLHIGDKTYTRWESGRERLSKSMNQHLCLLYDGKITAATLRTRRDPLFDWGFVNLHIEAVYRMVMPAANNECPAPGATNEDFSAAA